jgi:cullin-associated NEDD8-dissociated protein 1
MERRICAAVLKQLDDPGNDVKSMAVKCLENLIKKVQQTQVGEICDKLTSLIVDGKDELRDIYSIGTHSLTYSLTHSLTHSLTSSFI